MESSYYTPGQVGSFGGVYALYRASKGSVNDIRNWLSAQDTYTLHKPIRKKFLRRKTYSHGIDSLHQSDLMDISHLQAQNDARKFLLIVVDVFSKFDWVRAIKSTVNQYLRFVVHMLTYSLQV